MKRIILTPGLFILLFLSYVPMGFASDQQLPVVNGEEVVAMVNDDPITLGEFNYALSSIHSDHLKENGEKQATQIDYKGIMDRLITLRLIRLEAINIGLNELPEVREAVDVYARKTLIGLLRGEHVKGIEADEEEIDRLYKEAITEYKLKAFLFNNKDEAEKAEEEIRAGGNFDDILKRVLADNQIKESAEGIYFASRDLMPQVIETISKMKIGDVSPVVDLKIGYLIFRLEDIRQPENPSAKENAEKQALELKRKPLLEKYKISLIEKYAKVDEKVLDSIDYDSTVEEFEKLRKDTRVVAQIEDEQPITVAELTNAINNEYFHGVEAAIKRRRLNDKKREFLFDKLLLKRIYRKEALKLGLDKSPAYKGMIKDYENSVLFDMFIKKVIVPDVKVETEAVERYYQEHLQDYSSPEVFRVSSLAFEKKVDAEHALDRLSKGTDFKWLKDNAEGQVDKEAEGLLDLEGNLTVKDLDEDLQKAISGAKPGDARLYRGPEKYYYVLFIQDVTPPYSIPLENVRNEINKTLFKENIAKSVNDWADKLRKVYDVKIYEKEF